MKSSFLVALFLVFATAFSHADYGQGNSAVRPVARHKNFRESLALAQKHWNQMRPAKYRFQYQIQCFCRDTEAKWIYVNNKKVIKVEDVATGKELDRSLYAHDSIDGILSRITNYLKDNPYKIMGAFDAVNGIPVSFYVDEDELMIDEEMGYMVQNLEIM